MTAATIIINSAELYRVLSLRTAGMEKYSIRHNRFHAALGMTTELGEVATEVKRMFAYGKPLSADMFKHLCEEAGDFAWYVALAISCEIPAGVWRVGGIDHRLVLAGSQLDQLLFAVSEAAIAVGNYHAVGCLSNAYACADAFLLICDALGVDPFIIMGQNVAKLLIRFPIGTTDIAAAAEARADKGGLSARES